MTIALIISISINIMLSYIVYHKTKKDTSLDSVLKERNKLLDQICEITDESKEIIKQYGNIKNEITKIKNDSDKSTADSIKYLDSIFSKYNTNK